MPIFERPLPNLIVARPEQPENALSPIVATLSGIVIVARPEQPQKACVSIVVITSGRVILGIAESTAYAVIREWNKELKSEGYFTKAGSIPRAYFEKKCYGFAEAQ